MIDITIVIDRKFLYPSKTDSKPAVPVLYRLDDMKREATALGMKIEYSLAEPYMTGAIIRGKCSEEQLIEIKKIKGIFCIFTPFEDPPNYCFNCQCLNIKTEIKEELIPFLGEEDLIPVNVPVRICTECNSQWTDHEAEDIREAATKPYRDRFLKKI